MPHPLFLQTAPSSRWDEIPRFLETFWPVLLPTAVGLAAVYLLLPRVRHYRPLWGGALAGLALALGGWLLIRTDTALPETVLFYSFSGIAVVAGGLLITLRNPVHAALSFALVVLSTCGLFLLQAAPFLMAATIIVYAGAIIVTFLFVIMLAQQEGFSNADYRSREPFLATVAGFVLLGALLCVLQRTYEAPEQNPTLATLNKWLQRTEDAAAARDVEAMKTALGENFFGEFRTALGSKSPRDGSPAFPERYQARLVEILNTADVEWHNPDKMEDRDFLGKMSKHLNEIRVIGERLRQSLQGTPQPPEGLPLSPFSGAAANAPVPPRVNGRPPERLPAHNVAAVGRSLFSDYLLAFELAGILLLVATIGAIAIAARRTEGLR
jgi:NADH-quinone oxidoreductase subunit J